MCINKLDQISFEEIQRTSLFNDVRCVYETNARYSQKFVKLCAKSENLVRLRVKI